MNKFKELQNKHLALLEKYKEGQSSGELIQEVEAYIEEVKVAGKDIPSSQQRDQLRANLRFWGAFIYERKKVFPDISLWPSTKKSPAGQWRGGRGLLLAAGILGGVILVLIAGLAILTRLGPGASSPGYPSTEPASTPTAAAPASEVMAMQSAASSTPSPEPTQIGTATSTDLPTSTPTSVETATSFLMTSTPVQAMLPAPTSSGFNLGYSYSQPDCSQRKIEIEWQDDENAVAYLSPSGSLESVPQEYMISKGVPTSIVLENPESDESYLLQIKKDGKFIFDPLIIQFTADCAYNQLSIKGAGYSQSIGESILEIDLALVDWGPRSLADPSSWIAELSIKQDGGGIYMYNGSPIKEETIFIKGFECSSQPFTIGRASNGSFQEATFSLYLAGPLCPQSGSD